MIELNTFNGSEDVAEAGFDTLRITAMGSGVAALSQVSEDSGDYHCVVIGEAQRIALITLLIKMGS